MSDPVLSVEAGRARPWWGTARRVAWVALVGLLYACVVVALDVFDWDRGHLRAVVLGLTAFALLRLGMVPPAGVSRPAVRCVVVLLLAMLAVRTADVVRAYRADNYRPIDVAITTLEAIALTGRHQSPYATAFDRRPETTAVTGFGFFDGYKYGPMNIFLYYPLARARGIRGIYITNFLFYVALAALLVEVGRTLSPEGNPAAGLLAALLLVATPFVWRESAVQGVNDGVQAALVLGAILLRVNGRATLAGLVVGLALASKLMPAGAALIALLPAPRRLRFLVATAVTAVSIFMTQFSAAPKEMIANLVVFQMNRAPDSTALRYFLPPELAVPWTLLVAGALAILATQYLARGLASPRQIVRFLAVFLAVFFLASNAHRNYLVWLVPFLALEGATLALRGGSAVDATPPSS